MAQAAKHLRKNKDLEAQAEQERKEKEEEKVKKRSRSRDKKRKVLGLFTGGVVRGRVMGVGWWGWGGRKVEATPPPHPLFLCHTKLVRGAGAHMEIQRFYCVNTQGLRHMRMSSAYKHGETVEHTACFPTPVECFTDCPVRLIRQRSTVPRTVSPVTSLSRPLSLSPLFLCFHNAVCYQRANVHNEMYRPRRGWACHILQRSSLFFLLAPLVLSMWHCNDCRAKAAAFRPTGKSQAELAVHIVNNKSLLRKPPSAGTYHQAAKSTLFLWPLNWSHSDSLMKMTHPVIVPLCIGGKLVLGKWIRVQLPCEPAPCRAGCKPIPCWCSRDSVTDRYTERLQSGWDFYICCAYTI